MLDFKFLQPILSMIILENDFIAEILFEKDSPLYDTSLMVPEIYKKFIQKNKKINKNYRNFLHKLLQRNVHILKKLKIERTRIHTKYQKKGLKLKKINFKPYNQDWVFLKSISSHLGVSISYLVIELIKLEIEDNEVWNRKEKKVLKKVVPVFQIKSSLHNFRKSSFYFYSKLKLNNTKITHIKHLLSNCLKLKKHNFKILLNPNKK